jgi:hypothetical protein
MAQFLKLYESAIQRFTRGGFLIGDLVKFKENYSSDNFFKKQAVNYIEKINEFVKSGLNIRVSAVKPVYPNSYSPGNIQNEAESFLIDIVLEKAPGLYYDFVTVPAHVLEHIDTGINLAPVPDALKRPNDEIIDPEEVSQSADPTSYLTPYRQTLTSDKGDNKDVKSEITLPTKNTRIPSSPAEGDKDPAVASYTARYMPKKSRA